MNETRQEATDMGDTMLHVRIHKEANRWRIEAWKRTYAQETLALAGATLGKRDEDNFRDASVMNSQAPLDWPLERVQRAVVSKLGPLTWHEPDRFFEKTVVAFANKRA